MKIFKKSVILLLVVVMLFSQFELSQFNALAAAGPPTISPEGPDRKQTLKIPVTGFANSNPGVIWYQQDNGTFSARVDETGEEVNGVPNAGTNTEPYPARTTFRTVLDSSIYAPNNFMDQNNINYDKAYVKGLTLLPDLLEWVTAPTYSPASPTLDRPAVSTIDPRFLYFTTITGGPIHTSREQYSTRYGTNYPKVTVLYATPMALYWDGYVEEEKEIRLNGPTSIAVGEQFSFRAEIQSTNYKGEVSDWVDVSFRDDEIEWRTDRESVATVDTYGRVKGESPGTTTITAIWRKDGLWHLLASATVTVGSETPPLEPPPTEGRGSCTWTIAPPTQGASPKTSFMDPSATGVIRADNRGSERFNIAQGIPTSETLYANVFANNYLFQHTFANMSGQVNYQCSVSVTYVLQWQVPQPPVCGEAGCVPVPPRQMRDTVTKNYNFTLQRDYSYWEIKNLEVYAINRADVSNYALPGGSIVLHPTGYVEPSLSTMHSTEPSDHVRPRSTGTISYTPPVLNGGTSRPTPPDDTARLKAMAESQTGDSDVRNDAVSFNGSVIMDGNWTTKNGPTPRSIPAPTTIEPNVLYKSGLLISNHLVNASNTPSSGMIYYDLIAGNVNGGSDKQFLIHGINTVTVHTPVVNQASTSDDREHNQKTRPTAGRSALILDRPFTVSIPTSGAHRDITGYGNRDYAKYTRDKQVWFPFDVYREDRRTLIPKETWISIPVSQIQTTFYMPVWVDEGNYDVLFRTFAENSPSSFTSQMNANLDLTHHVATQVVPVEVIGRVYDFRITDIADFNWETVFRTQRGSAAPTGNAYWVGTNSIDGAARGNRSPFVLPIRPGSHPDAGKKNVAVKTGYHVKFELKTMGNMFEAGDGIKITPTFYFVDSKGRNRQEVDLYYHSGNKRFIRIGSSEDVERRHVTLDTRLRNMSQQELTNTASSLWTLNGATGNRQTYIQQFLKNAKQPVYVGGYDVMLLPPRMRTFIGSMEVPSGVPVARAHASVQRWVGEYSLPAAPYVVPKGFNLAEYGRTNRLDDRSPIFLRDGYIIVNFNIETIRNQQVNQPHLQYIHAPLSNQWRREGFQHRFVDPYGATFHLQDGDVVYYHANLSSYDDFGTGGTH